MDLIIYFAIGLVVTIAFCVNRKEVLDLSGFLSSIVMWPITLIFFNFSKDLDELPDNHPVKQVIAENMRETGSPFGW